MDGIFPISGKDFEIEIERTEIQGERKWQKRN